MCDAECKMCSEHTSTSASQLFQPAGLFAIVRIVGMVGCCSVFVLV
jgi:hypothetical protein